MKNRSDSCNIMNKTSFFLFVFLNTRTSKITPSGKKNTIDWTHLSKYLKENITTLLQSQRIRSLQQEKTPVKTGKPKEFKNACYNCSVGQICSNEQLSERMKV